MSKLRSHIKSITMLNWRGIPFQIIEMDRLITALEGKNGAGKTTVLAAFYVSLLPDASLVRLPNVGDAEGSGKESGLHGKLGENGPAYSILELVNPLNERVLAGVQLNARTDPDVDMDNTFVVTKIPANVPLERFLAFEKDGHMYIPEISQIEQLVGVYGGELQRFGKIADYGAKLFDLGILPVSLRDKKEREKFNRLLQTSLLGGFSKKLQERLKEYILPDDTQTRDSVGRMKTILDGCRRTKKQIENMSKKIEMVTEIHSNSSKMMGALFSGIKIREQQICREVEGLRAKRKEAIVKYKHDYKAFKAAQRDIAEFKEKVAAAKIELATAQELLDKTRQAHGLSKEVAADTAELKILADTMANAQANYSKAKDDYQAALARINTMNERLADISNRLADAEDAWKKISQEAGLYLSARQCLEDAKSALPDKGVSVENSRTLLAECEVKKAGLAKTSSDIDQKLQTAEKSREDFQEALVILEAITETSVLSEQAWEEASKTEREFRQMNNMMETNANLAAEIPKIEEKASKQAALKTELDSLQEHNIYATTKGELSASYKEISDEVNNLGGQRADNDAEIRALGDQMRQHAARKITLQEKCVLWDEAIALRTELEKEYSRKFDQAEDVTEQINALVDKEKGELGKRATIESEITAIESKITNYIKRDSDVDARLEKIAKELDGKLVISLFEHLDLDEAAEKEARLGPLVNAIMVTDVQAALEAIEQMNEKAVPDEVWLVEKSKLDSEVLRLYKKVGKSIVAQMDKSWRITRFPDRPKVGHQARRQMIADLRDDKEKKREEIKKIDDALKALQGEIKKLHLLAGKFSILTERRPYDTLADLETDINGCKEQMSQADGQGKILRSIIGSKSTVLARLSNLLPDGYLLDEEDLSCTLATMKELAQQVNAAKARYVSKKALLGELDKKMHSLRVIPPTTDECDKMKNELTTVKADWSFWIAAHDTLAQLIDKIEHFKFEKSYDQRQATEDPAPELRKQQKEISRLQAEESGKLIALQEAEKQANESCTNAQTAHSLKHGNIRDNEEKLAALGVDDSEKALEDTGTAYNKIDINLNQLTGHLQLLEDVFHKIQYEKNNAKDEKKANKKEWSDCNNLKYKPAQLAWEDAKSHCLTDKALTRLLQVVADQPSTYLTANEAYTERRILENTVKKQPALELELKSYVDSLLAAFNGFPVTHESGKDQVVLQKYLTLWKEVVAYISQILPRDCVHTDNPELAIGQMNDSYNNLTLTLSHQEADFQVESEAVANSIKSKIQTARTSVRKHNSHLDGTSFGNIKGIKIDFELHEDMMAILDVMQNKEQWDLFAEDLPLHEVMKKIYSIKIGGTVHGDELLDYKKYIKLTVKIQRKSSHGWETSFMSTGEAIGTGAAILMVILMTWETSASFFRDRDHQNSLRFLMMDEATRLDNESIKTLLDFCKKLDIQFLLAGPKFEAEECGEGTTYRIERKNIESSEHVLIRGRKGFGGNNPVAMAV